MIAPKYQERQCPADRIKLLYFERIGCCHQRDGGLDRDLAESSRLLVFLGGLLLVASIALLGLDIALGPRLTDGLRPSSSSSSGCPPSGDGVHHQRQQRQGVVHPPRVSRRTDPLEEVRPPMRGHVNTPILETSFDSMVLNPTEYWL